MRIKTFLLAAILMATFSSNMALSDDNSNEMQARKLIDEAVKSMGGEAYMAN